MRGLLIMFGFAAAIGAAIYWLTTSVWAAVGVTVLVLVGWFLLNVQAGSTGLIKANLFAYFSGRRRGMSHDEAVANVVITRYTSEQHRLVIAARLDAMRPFNSDEDEIKELVYIIFEYELGARPSHDWQMKVRSQIALLYQRFAPSVAAD